MCQVLLAGDTDLAFSSPGLPLPPPHFQVLWRLGCLFLPNKLFQNLVVENLTFVYSLKFGHGVPALACCCSLLPRARWFHLCCPLVLATAHQFPAQGLL